jgi:Protein of unknown function (DUF2380)
MPHANRFAAPLRRALMGVIASLAVITFSEGPRAGTAIKLAVFPFELVDFSAAGGVVATSERDAGFLKQATDEAKRWLAESGRYALVDTSGAQDEPVKKHALHDCQGCVGPIAKKLGAQQAVIGTITRISRTEYTLLIEFVDAATGEPTARYFTGLRMGADYSWSRGVTSLMKNRILAQKRD